MKKINIIFFIFDLGLGGAELQVILHAIGLKKMGNFVSIVYFSEKASGVMMRFDNKSLKGINFINMSNISILNCFPKIKNLIQIVNQPNTVLHSHMWKANFISRLVSIFSSVPIINTVHAVNEGKYLVPFLYKINSNNIDLISTVSHHAKNQLKINKMKKNTVKVFDNILDPKFYNFKNNERKKVKSEYKLLFIGRLVSDKNIFNLLKAFVVVAQNFENLTLHIVGDGSLCRALELEILEENMQDRVFMHGSVSPKEHILSADLVVLPSKHEAFGLVLLEAAVCGVDIICSQSVPTNELFKDNIHSFDPDSVNDIAKAIRNLYLEPTSKNILNDRANYVLKRYSDKSVCKLWYDEYCDLIGSKI